MPRARSAPPEADVRAARYTLTIDGWTPPSANKLWKVSSHWAKGHRIKREAANEVAVAAYLARPRIPPARGRRRVSVVATYPGQGRLPDPDNIIKILFDAIGVNGLIVDDSAVWVEIGSIVVERGPDRCTLVELEDLP